MIATLKSPSDALYVIKPGVPIKHWSFITLHHTGNVPLGVPLLGEWIDALHRNGGREGYDPFANGMGYHFLVNTGGEIEYGDRWYLQLPGGHNNSLDKNGISRNHSSIGVCMAGNFSKSIPTTEQLSATRRLIASLGKPVRPHFLYKETECPGKIYDGTRNWLQTWEEPC